MPDSDASSGLPFFYTNVVHLSIGPFDLTMDFGFESPEDRHHEGHRHSTVARVAMSPSHAKSMLKVLVDRIASYEEQYGVIPSPHFEDH